MNRTSVAFTTVLGLAIGALSCATSGGNNSGSNGGSPGECPGGQIREGNRCVPGPADAGPSQRSDGQRPPVTPNPDPTEPPVVSPRDGLSIFDDDFANDTRFAGFGGAANELSIDTTVAYRGQASIKIELPTEGYAGGAIVAGESVDLSRYNVLSFWAKASQAVTLDKAGFGNDAESADFEVGLPLIELTTGWQQILIPIPAPAKLTAIRGLFYFAQGAEGGQVTLWFDEMKFETLETSQLGTVHAQMPTLSADLDLGQQVRVTGTTSTFTIGELPQTLLTAPVYFDYDSSEPSVAGVDDSGLVTAISEGTAVITASLAGVRAEGQLTVNAMAGARPTAAAPSPPSLPADRVISLFSDMLDDVAVDTWSADWDKADYEDIEIEGNATKVYTNVDYAGIEFHRNGNTIDARAMTHFHIDVFLPVTTSLKIKLVDFGIDKAYGGGDDNESELVFNTTSEPALARGQWLSLDLPLDDFVELNSRRYLAQLILASDRSTIYVDNVYFYRKQ